MHTTTTLVTINGVVLHTQTTGSGDLLVLVHGSWGDGDSWAPVVEPLAERYKVVTYDRRGHSRSEEGDQPPGRHDHAADLAALVETLGGPAHLVGNSSGASIALTVAAARPDLVRTAMGHEPATLSLVENHPDPEVARSRAEAIAGETKVRDLIRAGDPVGAVRFFIDEVAVGPGTWDDLPAQRQEAFVANASTFLADFDDPDHVTIEIDGLGTTPVPILLSRGTTSPLMLMAATDALADLVPGSELTVLPGAGHIPHLTHPALFIETLRRFHARTATTRGATPR
jgi:pimeloyl-ACP methyl ester carboxylesterase